MKPKTAERLALLEADLARERRRVHELKAQLASTLGAAFDTMPKASEYHGSAVILTITAIGGLEVVAPFAIRDGLSPKAVAALQADIARSFELATTVNPAMARSRGYTE